MLRRLFYAVVALTGVAVAGAVAGYLWLQQRFDAPGPLAAPKSVVIERGAGVAFIAQVLADAGVVDEPLVFTIGVRLFSRGQTLKAGEYEFAPGMSQRQAMQLLIDGGTLMHRLTMAEGLTSAEVLALVAAAEALTGDMPAVPPEGSLLPETYFFSRGETRAELVRRMTANMADTLAELWAGRDPNLPLRTPEEAVVLASIVEKETGVAAERPRVAAVFINRLNLGMALQSDPTIIYALTLGKAPLGRELTRADLQNKSPYNTYVTPGLPPGPIANPGRAALEAVLHPATTKDLFFVADGTGGHAFAETLDEHNKNVAAWRKLRNP